MKVLFILMVNVIIHHGEISYGEIRNVHVYKTMDACEKGGAEAVEKANAQKATLAWACVPAEAD